MSIKVMIIDAQADFRTLLVHHVTVHWPDAIISAYDPVAAGGLPAEFSGAGNDVVLLGNSQGDEDPLEILTRFSRVPGFPPVFYFGNEEDRMLTQRRGAQGFFTRRKIPHAGLIVALSDALRSKRKVANTDELFVGDVGTGIHPLIRGYRMIRKLAVSEHSAVYLAEPATGGSRIALKVLRQLPDLSEGIGAFDRFLQEYEMISGLNHPNIVRIFDLGVSDDHSHIAMEYLSGGDLRRHMELGLSTDAAVDFAKQIASALACIHSLGITHRDLKPGNIMLRDKRTLALIDFGLAKRMRLESEITGNGQIFGTPYYMSPEQGHAIDVDTRSDIYSFGVIFFEMLTGQKPYYGSNAMGIIYKHTHAPIPELPPRLSQYQPLINSLLAKNPEERMQTINDVFEWL